MSGDFKVVKGNSQPVDTVKAGNVREQAIDDMMSFWFGNNQRNVDFTVEGVAYLDGSIVLDTFSTGEGPYPTGPVRVSIEGQLDRVLAAVLLKRLLRAIECNQIPTRPGSYTGDDDIPF
jgi:hypothetical protein